MIAQLSGEVREKTLDSVVIDVRGVGYGVYMTLDDLSDLEIDKTAKVYVYEYIREQAHDLFGFVRITTKKLFEQLLEVNGVGPKMALNMLSIGSESLVRKAIAEGDLKFLQTANGVGKRVAERVVVDLKDKVGFIASDSATGFLQDGSVADDDAMKALIELGFSPADASEALRGVDKKLKTEQRVKEALKGKD